MLLRKLKKVWGRRIGFCSFHLCLARVGVRVRVLVQLGLSGHWDCSGEAEPKWTQELSVLMSWIHSSQCAKLCFSPNPKPGALK